MLTVGTLGEMTPVAAAEAGDQQESSKVTIPAGAKYVEGEAIVCYKTERDLGKPEETVKSETETELKKEDFVNDADALLVLEDVDEAVISEEAGEEDPAEAGEEKSAEAGEKEAATDAEDEGAPGVITLVKSDHLTTQELIAELEQQEDVLYAEPNYIYSLQSEDLSGNQWEYNGSYGIGADGWNTYSGDTPTPAVDTSKQVVAIIDTGVDYNHEDLKSVMWNEGLNYPQLVEMGGGMYGFNAVQYNSDGERDDSTNPMDLHGHGTHCAGIVAAAWNGSGVSGVTSGTRIMAIRIFNDMMSIHADEMIRAYEYVIAAKKAGVNVVATNNSYGGPVQGVTEFLVLEEAGKQGIVCAFAAGNDSKDLDCQMNSSSIRGRFGNVLVVGASTETGKRAAFSDYGSRDVDVFAPGVNIWSTLPMGKAGPNLNTSVLSVDGKEYKIDYSTKTDLMDDVFGLEGTNAAFSILQAGDGKNVLHVEPGKNKGRISFRTKNYDDMSSCKGILIRLWADQETGISYDVNVEDENGETPIKQSFKYMQPGLNEISIAYPDQDDDEKEKKNIRFSFDLETASEDFYGPLRSVEIREIRFTDKTENYECWNGTSMATPIVTGALAVLSAVYPGDSAEKLAARVTGSVQRNEYLEGRCISDGLFRLDKAVTGDTYPVPGKLTVNADTFTVEGYFFGDTKGMLKLGENVCNVRSWTDTKIVADLPENYEAGDHLVEVTGGKGSGHRRFRLGTAKNLAARLPLPDSTFTEDGNYAVSDETMKKYHNFYGGDAKALIGMDGYLYALFATGDLGTAVFRYKISTGVWEQVCESSAFSVYSAVAWNGKILLLGANPPKNKAALGILDLGKKEITWKVYDEESFEELTTMVNNGYGIYLLGGRKAIFGNDKNAMENGPIRRVDPVKMTVEELKEDEAGAYGFLLTAVSDPNGRIYYGTGQAIKEPNDISYYAVEINGEKTTEIRQIKGGKLFDEIYRGAGAVCGAAATKDGVLITGMFELDESDNIVTDTWLLSYDGKKVTKQPEVFSTRQIANPVVAGYRGQYYVLGQTIGETTAYFFSSIKADVIDPFGEHEYQNEWIDGIRYDKNGFRTHAYSGKASWKKDRNGWWYSTGKGTYLKNCWARIDGSWYFFDKEGYMEKNAYRKGYYLGNNGSWDGKAPVMGWKQEQSGWWYSLAGGKYLKNGWAKIDGNWYYFDKKGYAVSSAFVNGWWIGKNSICSYKYQSKWKKDKNGWWYGDSTGWYAKDADYIINGVKYTFNSKGYCVNP